MSVNTPKRPKTAYSPGQPSNEQFSVDASHLDPFYAIPDNYIPNGNPAWSWQPNTSETYPLHNGSTVNTVLSPSSSCGSPEETSAGMHRLLDIVPKTPTCTKKDRAVIPFPTPTTSTLPDGMLQMSSNSGGREHKRGRPRSESLTNLMMEGSTSPSSIKCKFCHRVFPREKSLAAHLRTHTGERPYVCDYPGCTKSFTQSGQMKTHQRLHTGERPFICAVPSCEMRFTHANRHCPVHVNSQLKRDDKFVVNMTPEENEEVLQWLEKYRAEREDKSTPTRKTPQRSRRSATTPVSAGKSPHLVQGNESQEKENHLPRTPIQDRSLNGHHSNDGKSAAAVSGTTTTPGGSGGGEAISICGDEKKPMDENECPVTPSTPSNNPYKSRKGLMVELDMNAGLAFSPLAPLKMKPQPKLIQWQEPLSQGEEDDDDDDDDGAVRASKYYQNEENVPMSGKNNNNSQQKQQAQDKLHNLKRDSPRKYSPSKKALKQNSSTFNPKKKWLREACMEDLAKPLDQTTCPSVLGSPQKLQIKSMNLLRPTVLMLASKDKQIPLLNGKHCPDGAEIIENNRKWMGQMALMQLATEEVVAGQPAIETGLSSLRAIGPLPVLIPAAPSNGIGRELSEYTQL